MARKLIKLSKQEQLAKRRKAYQEMPRDKHRDLRDKENAGAKRRRDSETPEQREARLALMRERARARLAAETTEQRQARLLYLKAYRPKYRVANAERIVAYSKSRYSRKRDEIIAKDRAYRRANPHIAAIRAKRKRATDPCYAIAGRLRCRLRSSLLEANATKAARTFDLVGCSPQKLVAWIEKQFLDGMTWDNRSQWHVDHIVPLIAFDLTCEGQQRVAFHYTNLRPLWAIDNIVKGKRIPVPQNRFFWSLRDIAEARRLLDSSRTMPRLMSKTDTLKGKA